MTRPSWDRYFLDLARAASTRATCDRLHVGVVLVRDKHVLSSGYNGSLPGAPHCDDVGHQIDSNGACVRTSHAEANAVASAARRGISLDGATAYLTDSPCRTCARLLVMAGVTSIVYEREYRLTEHLDELRAVGVTVVRFGAST